MLDIMGFIIIEAVLRSLFLWDLTLQFKGVDLWDLLSQFKVHCRIYHRNLRYIVGSIIAIGFMIIV
jgi:hypothetical protein